LIYYSYTIGTICAVGAISMIYSGAVNLKALERDIHQLVKLVEYYKGHKDDIDHRVRELLAIRKASDVTMKVQFADFKERITEARLSIRKIYDVKVPVLSKSTSSINSSSNCNDTKVKKA